MVTIRTRKGLCIQKEGLDHQELNTLVEKLKGLCLSINGRANFYYLPELHNMRYKTHPLYMYLDNELMDIEYLCCLAHARAKFKYAYDQENLQARIFLELIAKLYGMEESYRREKLTANEIYSRRNSQETTKIIEKIRTELYDLLANPDESRSELMSKAFNYLKTF